MKSIVVAYDSHRGIGASNDLLWQRDLPADLTHFKKLTMGGSLIMGRNTFESIGRALPGRENIVVTHRPLDVVDVIAVNSLAAAYEKAHGNQFIIGGGQITINHCPILMLCMQLKCMKHFRRLKYFSQNSAMTGAKLRVRRTRRMTATSTPTILLPMRVAKLQLGL